MKISKILALLIGFIFWLMACLTIAGEITIINHCNKGAKGYGIDAWISGRDKCIFYDSSSVRVKLNETVKIGSKHISKNCNYSLNLFVNTKPRAIELHKHHTDYATAILTPKDPASYFCNVSVKYGK